MSESLNPSLDRFLETECYCVPGSLTTFSEFYSRFQAWLPANLRAEYSAKRTSIALPERFPRGKRRGDSTRYVANLSFTATDPSGPQYRRGRDGYLTVEPPN